MSRGGGNFEGFFGGGKGKIVFWGGGGGESGY